METIIRDANPDDAPFIAYAVMEAVGKDICNKMAGEGTIEDVKGVFTLLAMKNDSQYSWKNSRIACNEHGQPMGVCVSYDGASLKSLRKAFFKEANRVFNWNITDEEVDQLAPETNEEEFYLDSIAVLPQFRKRGVATSLIQDAEMKAAKHQKPLGLLVDDHNPNARRLYESLGFKEVGKRPFAGVMMTNMRKIL